MGREGALSEIALSQCCFISSPTSETGPGWTKAVCTDVIDEGVMSCKVSFKNINALFFKKANENKVGLMEYGIPSFTSGWT